MNARQRRNNKRRMERHKDRKLMKRLREVADVGVKRYLDYEEMKIALASMGLWQRIRFVFQRAKVYGEMVK